MLDDNVDTPSYWEKKAKKSSIISRTPPAWVYASKYWRAKFLDISKDALSFIEKRERSPRVLKTDLWNEGIETQRMILRNVKDFMIPEGEFFGIDISRYTVLKAASSQHDYLNVLQSSITNLPFKCSTFDLVLDMSTIDHIEVSLRKKAIQEYKRVLKSGGVMALVFDNRGLPFYFSLLKDFSERITGKPRKTRSTILHFGPDSVERLKRYLNDEQFDILAEGIVALNIGINTLFLSRNSRIFNFILGFEPLQRAIYRLEKSKMSKYLEFLALQYFITCTKN